MVMIGLGNDDREVERGSNCPVSVSLRWGEGFAQCDATGSTLPRLSVSHIIMATKKMIYKTMILIQEWFSCLLVFLEKKYIQPANQFLTKSRQFWRKRDGTRFGILTTHTDDQTQNLATFGDQRNNTIVHNDSLYCQSLWACINYTPLTPCLILQLLLPQIEKYIFNHIQVCRTVFFYSKCKMTTDVGYVMMRSVRFFPSPQDGWRTPAIWSDNITPTSDFCFYVCLMFQDVSGCFIGRCYFLQWINLRFRIRGRLDLN